MAETIPGLVVAGDLSGQYQNYVVMGTTSRTIVAVTANTQVPLGVLVNKPNASGEAATVVGPGNVVKCTYGGTITAGDLLSIASDGEVVAATVTTANVYMCGIALESGVDQDVKQILTIAPWKGSA